MMAGMNSRERISLALNHREPDRVPVDLGASATTGIHVSVVYRLRQALGLDAPGVPVKVVEPYQMLGEVKADLQECLGVDVAGLGGLRTLFGFVNEGWKPWSMADGTSVLVPGGFNTTAEPNGDIFMYPQGDRSAPPSGRMPRGGWYFDALVRQPPIDDARLNVEDNLEEFGPIGEADLDHFRIEAERLFAQTDKAILANFGGTGFGDIALVPAPWLKHPRGIRDIEEWYVSTSMRRDYVQRVFERQCAIGLANLEKIHGVVGDKVAAVFVTGTDFGTQQGLFISPRAYREMFQPFHRAVNDWIHRHTAWKSFMHTCGSVFDLLDDFIAAGFDILNPVQCSAAKMDPVGLKRRFGDRIVFWGGGVDTQQILPFGKPADVRRQVAERCRIFGPGGGFVFNPIHNIQALTPVGNVRAMFDTVRERGQYPLV